MMVHVKSLARVTSATIVLIVVLTVWGEMSGSFEAFLAGFTGHHWITKSAAALVFFMVLYLALTLVSGRDETDAGKGIMHTVWISVASGFVIFAFYVMHFLEIL